MKVWTDLIVSLGELNTCSRTRRTDCVFAPTLPRHKVHTFFVFFSVFVRCLFFLKHHFISFLFHFLLPLFLLTRQAKLTESTDSNVNPQHHICIHWLTKQQHICWPFLVTGQSRCSLTFTSLAIRPIIPKFTSWVLVVLLILMFECYLSPLQFLSSKTDCAIENQGRSKPWWNG